MKLRIRRQRFICISFRVPPELQGKPCFLINDKIVKSQIPPPSFLGLSSSIILQGKSVLSFSLSSIKLYNAPFTLRCGRDISPGASGLSTPFLFSQQLDNNNMTLLPSAFSGGSVSLLQRKVRVGTSLEQQMY